MERATIERTDNDFKITVETVKVADGSVVYVNVQDLIRDDYYGLYLAPKTALQLASLLIQAAEAQEGE